jgi:putative transposase
MTRNDPINGPAFVVFIEKFLCLQLWTRAVVVMENLPAPKLASIVPMIEAVGASVIYLFIPILSPILLQLNNGCHHSNLFCSGSLSLPRP